MLKLFPLEICSAAFTARPAHITDVNIVEEGARVEDSLLVLGLIVIIDFNSDGPSLSYQPSSFSVYVYAGLSWSQL